MFFFGAGLSSVFCTWMRSLLSKGCFAGKKITTATRWIGFISSVDNTSTNNLTSKFVNVGRYCFPQIKSFIDTHSNINNERFATRATGQTS